MNRRRAQQLRLEPGDTIEVTAVSARVDDLFDEDRAYRGRVILSNPLSYAAEAYRSIRANIFYSMPEAEIKTLSLTSSQPQEGKSMTTCNLAIAVAQTNKRVLLIDGDLHRPTIHRTLEMDPAPGLTSVLVGETEWRDALKHIVHDGEVVENPQFITDSPYEAGWLVKIKLSDPSEAEDLLSLAEYETHVTAEEH